MSVLRRVWSRYRGLGRPSQVGIAVALVVVVLAAAGSATNSSTKVTATGSPSTSSAPTTQSRRTSSVPPTTLDPDEAPDPSAVGAAPPAGAAAVPTASSVACRPGDPLANVYHPSRLRVINRCITVTGTVALVRREPDGDVHINLNLDGAYAGLTNARNVSGEHGALVVEIVPADEPGCTPGGPPRPATGTYDYGTCTGADESPPGLGAHVSVTGPYVLDTAHGWMEIHPAWAIGTPSAATTPPATSPPATSPPATTPPPTTPPATSPPAKSYVTPGAYCSPEGATGYSSGGVPMTCSATSCDGTSYGDRDRWRRTNC